MANSTRGKSAAKSRSSSKTIPVLSPRRKPAFSLWLHAATGQWAKKIRGRKYYFGIDKDVALQEYLRVKDDLAAGRQPPPPDEQRTTIKTLVNTFLPHKKSQVTIGELTQTSFNDYRSSGEALVEFFGKNKSVASLRPDDLLRYRQHLGKGGKSPQVAGNRRVNPNNEVGDYIATRRIMGHADNSISDQYRERFQDERLRKVVDHVHGWLFGTGSSENLVAI